MENENESIDELILEYDMARIFLAEEEEEEEEASYVVSLRDVTEKKQTEQELRTSLKEKETLLMEIHHRVKNNLAVVSGMMQLQAFDEEDKEFKNKLIDSVVRIKTMASIHEVLYQSKSFSRIQLDDNLKKLVSNIYDTLQINPNIALKYNLGSIKLNINQAIPCSLIVNEVVTNVFKHAFDDTESGKIMLDLSQNENKINIKIQDNGKGLPKDFNNILQSNPKGLGLKLISTLAEQLEAEYDYKSCDNGTVFTLEFEKSEVKGIGNARL